MPSYLIWLLGNRVQVTMVYDIIKLHNPTTVTVPLTVNQSIENMHQIMADMAHYAFGSVEHACHDLTAALR